MVFWNGRRKPSPGQLGTSRGPSAPPRARRLAGGWLRPVALALLPLGLMVWGVVPSVTSAQPAPEEAPLEEIAEPAAPPAAAPPVGAVPDGAVAPAAPAAAPSEESYLTWFTKALGWKYVLAFLLISISFVALTVMNFLASRRQSIVPPQLVEDFEARLKEKKYQEAYDLAKADESFLGQVLAAGLPKMSTAGYPEAIEAMQEVGEEETMKLEQRLSYVALIGTISPMVGLLGTVDGMVSSFTVIARSSTTPKPSELAAGISTALVTTLVGLWLAIPAVAIYHVLKNRLARLVLEAGIVSEQLLSRVSHLSAKKGAPVVTGAAPPTAPPTAPPAS